MEIKFNLEKLINKVQVRKFKIKKIRKKISFCQIVGKIEKFEERKRVIKNCFIIIFIWKIRLLINLCELKFNLQKKK